MKKLLALVLAVLMVVGLFAACNKNNNTTAPSGTTKPTGGNSTTKPTGDDTDKD